MSVIKRTLLVPFFVLIGVLILALSCSEEDNTIIIDTNQPPTEPVIVAPSHRATNVSLTPRLRWLCSDSDADQLTYDVYYGRSSTPPLVSSNQSTTSYSHPDSLEYNKHYYWSIIAKDEHGAATSDSITWYFQTKSEPIETINAPNRPTGHDSGLVNQILDFATSGSSSNLGHSIEYQFDWNDGTYSGWSSPAASHSWPNAGTYYIRAQARCVTHTNKLSSWSASKTIVITEPDSPVLAVSTNSLDFDSTKTSITFNISNTGTGTLNWDVLEIISWLFVDPDSGTTTTETDQLTVTVNRSGLTPGTHTDIIIISSDGGTDVIDVSMIVLDPPLCTVEPTTLDFGDILIGQSTDMLFRITNVGGGVLIGSVSESSNHYSIVGTNRSYNLGYNQSKTFIARFAPVDAGTQPCTIETGTTCSNVSCTGVGIGPECSVLPPTLDFGNLSVGQIKDLTFVIENTGGGILTGSVSEICPQHSIVLGKGPYSILPGWTRDVTVRFAPTTSGLKNCHIETGNSSCQYVNCTGSAICSIALVSPTSSADWTAGTNQAITWDPAGAGPNVKLELYKGSSYLCPISSSTSNTGSFPWTVTECDDGTASNYRVKITNLSDGSCYDYSDYFTITVDDLCLIDVTVPWGGSVVEGMNITIQWNKTDECGSEVKIELYENSSKECTISPSTSNDGAYPWAVTDCGAGTSSDYRVKITDLSTNQSGFSEYFKIDTGPFTETSSAIADAFIETSSPNFNNCTGSNLLVGFDVDNENWSLVLFDPPNYEPAFEQTIISAELILTRMHYTGSPQVIVCRVGASWSECAVTVNNAPDKNCTDNVVFNAYGGTNPREFTIDVTDIVRKWYSGSNNYGFYLAPWGDLSNLGYVHFYSSEYNTEPSFRPKLRITYYLE